MYAAKGHHDRVFHQGKVVKITREVQGQNGAKVTFDVPLLKTIFGKYEDYLVAVYTVAGPFRSGKSFLQNLLVRYLKGLQLAQNGSSVTPDLGSLNEQITRVFDFKSGQVAHTKGIHILDEPFLIDFVENGVKKEVALFLVDTQGLFDIEASERDVTIMGTLNFLLSSLQCFNVISRISKVELDYIFKFADKVRQIKEQAENASPFQKGSLMFLVRDWFDDDEDEDYPHGLEGGEKYLRNTTTPSSDKAQEHNMMQKFFHNAFGDIACFLMPEPGRAVRKRDVTLDQLDEDFRHHMLEFFKFLTNPNKIVIKKIGGQEQTCGQLCNYMEVVAAALNSDKSMDDPQSFILIAYESRMHSLTSKCAQMFIVKIQDSKKDKSLWQKLLRKVKGVSTPEQISVELSKMQEEVMVEYYNAPKCGEVEFERGWEQELVHLLQQIKKGFVDCAVAEKEFVDRIKDFHKWVTETATALNFNKESYKEEAKKEREKLLKELKTNISDTLYEQCHVYFRNQTNLILAETAKEVEAYMEKLNNVKWWLNLAMGALALVPGLNEFGIGGLVAVESGIAAVANLKGYAKAVNFAQEEVALSKYGPGKIEVQLCFGIIVIPLKSKIKLTA